MIYSILAIKLCTIYDQIAYNIAEILLDEGHFVHPQLDHSYFQSDTQLLLFHFGGWTLIVGGKIQVVEV